MNRNFLSRLIPVVLLGLMTLTTFIVVYNANKTQDIRSGAVYSGESRQPPVLQPFIYESDAAINNLLTRVCGSSKVCNDKKYCHRSRK